MANLYGVANPNPYASYVGTIGAANINCPVGVWTPVTTLVTLSALDRGIYYPLIIGFLTLQTGATAPSGAQMGFSVNGGSVVQPFPVTSGITFPNSFVVCPISSIGPLSSTAWAPPGSTLQVVVNPSGNSIITDGVGSQAVFILMRGPDQ